MKRQDKKFLIAIVLAIFTGLISDSIFELTLGDWVKANPIGALVIFAVICIIFYFLFKD